MDAPISLLHGILPTTVHVEARVPASHPSTEILGRERMGSGVLVARDGLVITANYVVMGARRLRLTLFDGRRMSAEIVAQDFESGLALLRGRSTDLRPARLLASDDLRPGAPVFAVGAVGPRERRVSWGVVTDLGPFDAYWEYLLDRGIVSSAANPGFGGGPLCDARGAVVGIVALNLNEIVRQSLAIPIECYAAHHAELLRFGRVTSRPRRAWIGVFSQGLEEGLVVAGLVRRGPGERGGLREGDVILRVDHDAVETRTDLYAALWRRQPGEHLVLHVRRAGRVQRLEILAEDRAEFYAPDRADPGPGPPGEGRGQDPGGMVP